MSKFPAVVALIAIITIGLARTAYTEPSSAQAEQKQAVVHLSHFTDDIHRVAMALKISHLMQQHGSQVTLFLDLEGVRLAERRQKLDLSWGTDAPTLATLYQRFTEGGGKVLLCPHCAASAHIGDMALRRHASIGTEEELAEMFVGAAKVVDY